MEHHVVPGDRIRELGEIEGVPLHEGGGPGSNVIRDEVSLADREVVEQGDRPTQGQLVGQVAADETRTPHDERTHTAGHSLESDEQQWRSGLRGEGATGA